MPVILPQPARRGWVGALAVRALCSGTLASLLSTLALGAACRLRGASFASGSNATSQWLWGRSAWRRQRVDVRHTVVGYAIHHASSVFWATAFEAWQLLRPPPARGMTLRRAVTVAAVAGVVDYTLVPKRLTPGFEAHLRPTTIPLVYAAFALGLALCPRPGARRRFEPGPRIR